MRGEEDQGVGAAPSSRGFLVIAGQQLFGTILAFVVWVLLARMLPVSKFGEFNAAFGVAMMAGTLANLGMAQYVTVPFRSAISTGDFQAARGLRRVEDGRPLPFESFWAHHIIDSYRLSIK